LHPAKPLQSPLELVLLIRQPVRFSTAIDRGQLHPSPLPVSEIAAGVVRSEFKSKNKTLATTVGIALADMAGVRRAGRGVYGLH
jgi:hypothetical protein